MFIKFKKIEIKNFMSIKEGLVDLSNQGYVIINGINNNVVDASTSNGSGKSSIIEAIVYALTGETIRGTKDVINRYASDDCQVILDFKVDSNQYKIIRTKEFKSSASNLKLCVNNKDVSGKGIRDSQKILEEYLPDLTSQLIGSVIVLGQGLPQRFTNNTPSGRKEVLEKLSKSDFMIEDIKDKLSKRKTELNEELRKYEDLILSNTTKKDVLNNQLIKLNNDKTLLSCDVDFDTDIKKYEEQLDYLEGQQVDTYNYSQQLNEKLNNKIKDFQDWSTRANQEFLNEKLSKEKQLEPYFNKLNGLKVELELKEKEILKFESIIDTCPTCGQHLPDVHKVDTSNLKIEKDQLIENLSNAQNIYSSMKENIDKDIKELKLKLDSNTEEFKKEGQELRELYNSISKQNDDYIKEINNIKLALDKVKLNKENHEKQKETIDKDINEVEKQLSQIDDFILYNNNEKDIVNQRLNVVNKMITIATRDFRGFLLSEIIKYIDIKAKEYCLDVFNTDKINFELSGNNISISYDGKEYENLSGGEKQRIDLIVQFSIRDMLCQFMNFSSNIIALDEIFDALDPTSCQNVINMLYKKLNDIESVFIISHHRELDIPYDKIINVVKDTNGVSYVE